jgi:hypothetical protein
MYWEPSLTIDICNVKVINALQGPKMQWVITFFSKLKPITFSVPNPIQTTDFCFTYTYSDSAKGNVLLILIMHN